MDGPGDGVGLVLEDLDVGQQVGLGGIREVGRLDDGRVQVGGQAQDAVDVETARADPGRGSLMDGVDPGDVPGGQCGMDLLVEEAGQPT